MQSLGTSLKMSSGTSPGIMTQLNSDCCTASGITCSGATGVQRVTNIAWNAIGLTGTFSPNIFSNLASITSIDLSNNDITGTMPVNLSQSLLSLNLGQNSLSGGIPTSWPSGLTELVLRSNALTGPLPLGLPQSLWYINWGENFLNGSIPTSWPSGLSALQSYSNLLTGQLPSTFPATLDSLNLGNNQLSGNIPSLPQSLTYLHLDTNLFTGPLPFDFPKDVVDLRIGRNAGLCGDVTNIIPFNIQSLWLGDASGNYGTSFTGSLNISKPLEIYIDRNRITDIQIADASALTNAACDISYNPLLDNPHLSNLGVCIKIGLFKLSISTTAAITKTSSNNLANKSITISLIKSTILSFVMSRSTTDSTISSSTRSTADSTTSSATKSTTHIFNYYQFQSNLEEIQPASMRTTTNNYAIPDPPSSLVSDMSLSTVENMTSSLQTRSNRASPLLKTFQLTNSTISLIFAGCKIIASTIVLLVVLYRTPFKREFKIKFLKKSRNNQS